MQYRVDHYLPRAFKAIEYVKVGNNRFIKNNGSISKEYNGYISSLGANIIQAGIKAALTFYEAEESGSKSDRRLVNAAINFILADAPDADYDNFHLSDILSDSPEKMQEQAEDILDAATALKLALRTYKTE
ncbi:hypothetical protein FACS1894160_4420 [Bacteroidia bacterium]|nr:hypothetical protein FACS1894123_12170 [Bacteroidia bacterium]GHV09092.1 hypothetical protein FACS1894160_4420 [Bacteroidia bacterium]